MVTEKFTFEKKKLILEFSQLSWYTLSNDSTRDVATTINAVILPKLPASQVNK